MSVAIVDGRVSEVAILRHGHGYGDAATLSVDGDGDGAIVVGQVGLPAPRHRRLRVICTATARFGGALCGDGGAVVLPPHGAVTLAALDGRWRILRPGLGSERYPSTKERRGCRSPR